MKLRIPATTDPGGACRGDSEAESSLGGWPLCSASGVSGLPMIGPGSEVSWSRPESNLRDPESQADTSALAPVRPRDQVLTALESNAPRVTGAENSLH